MCSEDCKPVNSGEQKKTVVGLHTRSKCRPENKGKKHSSCRCNKQLSSADPLHKQSCDAGQDKVVDGKAAVDGDLGCRVGDADAQQDGMQIVLYKAIARNLVEKTLDKAIIFFR